MRASPFILQNAPRELFRINLIAQQPLEIAELKLSSFKNSSGRVLAKKLYDFLMRKGYDFQLAQDVARIVAMKSGRHLDHENS